MSKTTRFYYFVFLLTAGAAILLYCFSGGISGNDFWWHVKTGEWICTHRTVPDRDIFSWYGTTHDFKWVAHEWLAEVFFWQLYRVFGEAGIFVFSISGAVLMTALLLVRIRKYATDNCLVTALYICLFCVTCSLFFYGRPQVFAFFLLYGEMYCLYEYMEGRKKWCLYLIPLIACLWGNLHGGSSNLSYLLVFTVLLGGVRAWKIGRIYGEKWTGVQIWQLLIVLLLSMGAVCLNPAGAEVFLYPYVNMADPVAMNMISEWASPDAKQVGDMVIFFVPAFLLCSGIIFGRKEVKAQDAVMMLLFLVLLLRSVRFIIWLEITASFWAFPYMIPCRLKEVKSIPEKVVLGVVELGLAVACAMGIGECHNTWENGNMITRVLEERVLDLLREDKPSRLFNDYNYGGALIYAGLPVFIDERADLYVQDGLLADGISLLLMIQVDADADTDTAVMDPEGMIAKYGFDAFLVQVNRPLYGYLHSHGDWYEEVLTTETTAYFRRK